MKTLLTLFLSCCSLWAFGDKATFQKLAEVNKCWNEQKDIPALPAYTPMGERAWIKLHLSLVEQTLRARDVSNLTAAQRQNRLRSLDDLHQYWQAGRFPVNEDYAYRTPIFIDKHDNFCAVGYLVKASGHEGVSRMIAAKTNLAYVREMNYPELNAWAKEYGFTTGELAWIQPGYPPTANAMPVGGGTDGEVLELYPEGDTLYVGGQFEKVNGTIQAGNIAYVTEINNQFTWHNMGSGVNGPVYAIQKFQEKLFVAGNFTMAGGVPVNNVAYWDGSAWHPAGCIYGTVKDLVFYFDDLYAVGDFDVCLALPEANFARWAGNDWEVIPGLVGHVNTAEVHNGQLVLGGVFKYNNLQLNIIKWDQPNSFQPFGNAIQNEVNDLESFHGTLYAATRYNTDPGLLKELHASGVWITHQSLGFTNIDNTVSYNTLCADMDTFTVGGNFNTSGMIYIGRNIDNMYNLEGGDVWFAVDSEINKMVVFKDKLFAGGKFKYDYDYSFMPLNGICYKKSKYPSSIPLTVRAASLDVLVYPNPARDILHVEWLSYTPDYIIYNLQGQKLLSGDNGENIDITSLPLGNYLIRVRNGDQAAGTHFMKE